MERDMDHGGKEEEKAGVTGETDYGNHGERDSFYQNSDARDGDASKMYDDIYYEDLEDMWYEIADGYRGRYPKLTDGDVTVEPGRFDRTVDRIGRRIENPRTMYAMK